MSNGGYMNKGMGQAGERIRLDLSRLNDNERAVLRCLRRAGGGMRNRQIAEQNGWDKPSKTKGSSMVRNALRRLVRSGLVVHGTGIGDGMYFAADAGEPAADVTLRVSGEAFDPRPSPRPITGDEIDSLRSDMNVSDRIKRTDCALYNACLDQAVSGKWEGFACTSCSAYQQIDSFQKAQDQLGLAAVRMAADLVEKYGGVCRKRGVKPGADGKQSRRQMRMADPRELARALDGD